MAILATVLLAAATAGAQDDFKASEATLKAAYLYRLPNFVAWPDDGHRGSPPFRLCLLGDVAPAGAIDAVEGRKVKGREIRLERLADAAEADRCELLFVRLEEDEALAAVLDRLRGTSVLTVGDARDFARRGGMIGFVDQRGKLGLEINPDAVEAAGLKISAKLLELSQIVEGGAAP